jgi:hypothetical protein
VEPWHPARRNRPGIDIPDGETPILYGRRDARRYIPRSTTHPAQLHDRIMKARKGRRKQPTRLQVSWTLVKEEPRVAILFWCLLVAVAAMLGFEGSILFNLILRADWPTANKVMGLLRFAAVADALVLASTMWGVRHFTIFSLLDRMLTHRLVGVVGLVLMFLAIYLTLMKPDSSHRLAISLAHAALMWAGSFLFFWVFLFYGRKRFASSRV